MIERQGGHTNYSSIAPSAPTSLSYLTHKPPRPQPPTRSQAPGGTLLQRTSSHPRTISETKEGGRLDHGCLYLRREVRASALDSGVVAASSCLSVFIVRCSTLLAIFFWKHCRCTPDRRRVDGAGKTAALAAPGVRGGKRVDRERELSRGSVGTRQQLPGECALNAMQGRRTGSARERGGGGSRPFFFRENLAGRDRWRSRVSG